MTAEFPREAPGLGGLAPAQCVMQHSRFPFSASSLDLRTCYLRPGLTRRPVYRGQKTRVLAVSDGTSGQPTDALGLAL